LRGVCILNEMVKERERSAQKGFDKVWEIGHAYYTFAKKYPDYTRAYAYFYSGRFDLEGAAHPDELAGSLLQVIDSGPRFWKSAEMAANRASNEVAGQIFELNREILTLISNAIRAGIAEGAFRRELDPEEAAIAFTLLLESVPRLRPDLAEVLVKKGIDRPAFARDIGDLMGFMLMGRPPAKRKKA
jgi:hypothetical protein